MSRSRSWTASPVVPLMTPPDDDDVTLMFTYRGGGRLDLASFTLGAGARREHARDFPTSNASDG
ncbi:hypothetical protein AB0M34_25680 [Nocardia sp. NPDC050193]